MKRIVLILLLVPLLGSQQPAWPYPLDGDVYTGITRLEGYRLSQEGKRRGPKQPPGGTLTLQEVDIRLAEKPIAELPEPDPDFTKKVVALLGSEADNYAVAILDLSDPDHPRFAEHRGHVPFNPGSVGKIVVGLGLFQTLADLYPDSIGDRERILRETQVTADRFILSDEHDVPLWNPETGRMTYRPLQQGDTASLWTYLDWMFSASSNAAASTVIREIMLMVHFGPNYPVPAEVADRFFRETPRKELGDILAKALQEPLIRNGLNLEELRQGKFFTWMGKRIVPGPSSTASARELIRYLLLLEEGRLVDRFSSREIKRLLYMTQHRIRYASHPALNNAAVYFKSGSLYSCRPEPGFACGKYKGNRINMMNSVAIIEAPAPGGGRLHYLAVVLSNVLRENSAVAHQTLAMRIHRLIEANWRQSGKAEETPQKSP